jgi:Arc/MetJ-type ribon-helix-helix transcriptional regulator
MTIEIRTPELERLVQEEILSGHFQNAEELITEAIHALRERNHAEFATQAEAQEATSPRKNLAQFLKESPFAGSDLDLERQPDYGRPIEL